MLLKALFLSVAVGSAVVAASAEARDFQYNRNVTLSVGQSVVLKGVRAGDCGSKAPSWGQIERKLPKSKTGSFSNGGSGTVKSNSCGKSVAARGVRFTAKKPGSESLNIYDDRISITVK